MDKHVSILGPCIIVSEKTPTAWCYFDLSDLNQVVCYKTPWPGTGAETVWTQEQLADKSPLYVFDPESEKPACYIMDSGKLYRVPLRELAGQPMVNAIEQPRITDNGIEWDLASGKGRAKDYKVKVEQFPTHIMLDSPVPELPRAVSTPEPEKTTTNPTIDMPTARDLLQIRQYTCIEQESQCPESLPDGTLYAWKHNEQWHFKAGLLGETKTGMFDTVLDKDSITMLNQTPENTATLIDGLRAMNMSRPLLKLNPAQQEMVIAAAHIDWPLSSDFTAKDQILMCQSIMQGTLIPENRTLGNEVQTFRYYLWPSTINQLFQRGFYDHGNKDATIADVILYINHLLAASARKLGDTSPLPIRQPPASSHVQCGKLPNADQSMSLIYQGLTERDSALFQLILTYESSGFERLSLEQLSELRSALVGISNPQHPEFREAANDLLAAISATRGISQESAAEEMEEICKKMMDEIETQEFLLVMQCSPDERAKRIASLRKNASSRLQRYIDLSDILQTAGLLTGTMAQANLETVAKHKYPASLANALVTLETAGLLTGTMAQANLEAVAKHQHPSGLARALVTLQTKSLLTGSMAQDILETVAKHPEPSGLANALVNTGLLTGSMAQAILKAVAKHPEPFYFSYSLSNLQESGLLTGDKAPAILKIVTKHPKLCYYAHTLDILQTAKLLTGDKVETFLEAVAKQPNSDYLADVLDPLQTSGLLTSAMAQDILEAVAKHPDPYLFVDALATLQTAGLLTGTMAQAILKTVEKHQNPTSLAGVLATLQTAGVLNGDRAQAILEALAKHPLPSLFADELIYKKNNPISSFILTALTHTRNCLMFLPGLSRPSKHSDKMDLLETYFFKNEMRSLRNESDQTNPEQSPPRLRP